MYIQLNHSLQSLLVLFAAVSIPDSDIPHQDAGVGILQYLREYLEFPQRVLISRKSVVPLLLYPKVHYHLLSLVDVQEVLVVMTPLSQGPLPPSLPPSLRWCHRKLPFAASLPPSVFLLSSLFSFSLPPVVSLPSSLPHHGTTS